MKTFLLTSSRREMFFLLNEGLVKFLHVSIYTIDTEFLVLEL